MIGKISGKLIERHPPQVLVDVHGVGYEIDVPMSTFYQLPANGSEVTLYTHLIVREDAHQLYGFASEQERRVFRQLLKISGVGARTALSVLSGMSVGELSQAVTLQEAGRLVKVQGREAPLMVYCPESLIPADIDFVLDAATPYLQQKK